MRTEDEINDIISIAFNIEATIPHDFSQRNRAEIVRETLDWAMEQTDDPPLADD